MEKNENPICFLGDVSVGKTAIIQRQMTGQFCVTQNTVSTFSYNIEVNGKALTFIDTAGQEKYHSLIGSFARNSKVIIIVFDITDSKSFNSVESYWKDYISNNCTPFSVMTVGNKSDLEDDRTISYKEGVELSNKMKEAFYTPIKENIKEQFDSDIDDQRFNYFETSALEGNGINFLFNSIANVTSLAQLLNKTSNSIQISSLPQDAPKSRCACSK